MCYSIVPELSFINDNLIEKKDSLSMCYGGFEFIIDNSYVEMQVEIDKRSENI